MLDSCFISLFSGAGGLDLGFEVAGWKGLYATDIDACAIETLRSNQGKHILGCEFLAEAKIEKSDVRSLTGSYILGTNGLLRGSVPLLIGGPPCQSWSSAGRQRGFADPRGQLFSDFVRIANELDVRWIMFENVRGLLTARGPDGQPGSALELIRQQLLNSGFQSAVTLVNAADYGVGQRRVRLIVFGYRLGDTWSLPAPSHDKCGILSSGPLPWVTLDDVLSSIPKPMPDEIVVPSGLLAHQMRGLPPGTGVKSPGKREATRPGGHWGYKQGAFIADPKKPARTVTANAQQDWIYDSDHGLRRLSPRECAAIQSFPQSWEFCGKRNDIYRLVGNAVPPRLAQVLGASLMSHMQTRPVLPISRADLAPLPPGLISAIRYTQREEFRNGASRRLANAQHARVAV